jgi:hypothetical protein
MARSLNELASRTFPFLDTFPLTMVFRKSLTELYVASQISPIASQL